MNPFKAHRPRTCYGCRALNGSPQSYGGYKCAVGFSIAQVGPPYPAEPCPKPLTVGNLVTLLQTKAATGRKPDLHG